jgi:hypothetical protein
LGVHTLFDAVASCVEFSGIIDRTVHYLKLHRGVNAITSRSWHILRHSEIRCIVEAIEASDQVYRQRLAEGGNECEKLSSLIDTAGDKLGPAAHKTCRDAVEALHWTFGVRSVIAKPFSTHVILAWPVRISAEFINLIEQRQPIPLIILAHWAVLLHAERSFWVFGNAGLNMLGPLLSYLGSYWDEWLELPRSVHQQG